MRIIPVLDIMAGQVVRGMAGRRSEYRPIVSQLSSSCQPLDVAQAFRTHFGLTELYLADLDAIAGAAPAWPIYTALRTHGFRLWVDAGVRAREQAAALADHGIEGIVVGLETVSGPETLAALCQEFGSDRMIFSLDLKGGQPLGTVSAWRAPDAWSIAVQAADLGVRRMIVLDLERVGMGAGAGTEELCRSLAQRFPLLKIVAGGGVRDRSDLDRLERCGVRAALVASALHDGRLQVTGPT
jgi:phosphoribosylformimino-5-aminoimidazole carboxamide ribotide isomerase